MNKNKHKIKRNDIKFLMVPGLWSSGPAHWQSIWEHESPEFVRVEQIDWDRPLLNDWMMKLEEYVVKVGRDSVIMIAHSLGCSLVAHWALHYKNTILGALLVAPTDCDLMQIKHPQTKSFSPIPTNRLPFSSVIIASQNDEFVSIERARYFASCWGSHLIDVGHKGHINADSNLGNWIEGRVYLEKLINLNELTACKNEEQI